MLQTVSVYLLKTIVVSAVLLLYYWAALRNKKFHYYNRFYLLVSVVISLVLPLVNLNLFTVFSSNDKAIQMFNVVYAEGESDVAVHAQPAGIDWQQLIMWLLAVVTAGLLLRLFTRVAAIYKIKKKYPVNNMPEFDFINTDLDQAPFTFLKNIFWRNDISIEESAGRLILQHELTHVKEKHSWDKLFMHMVVAVCWANPLYWLIQKELNMIHEFIADDKSVKDKDAAAFAEMLLQGHFGNFKFNPAHSFFYSPVKRRLIMLTTSKEPRLSYLRRMMALPLIACTALLFAFKVQKENIPVAGVPATSFKLVVDAGHGGKDDGSIGKDGTKEKDVVLKIAQKVKDLSGEYGIDVVMTRTEDVYMSPQEKVDFSNAQNADAFVSIHVDASAGNADNSTGFSTFISPDNAKLESSKILASAIQGSLKESFQAAQNISQRKVGIWVLKAANMPAALVECGYITNSADLAMMQDNSKIELIARKILEGVAAYANKKPVVSLELKSKENDAPPQMKKDTLPGAALYFINGEQVSKTRLFEISAEDIQSIEVLKNEDAVKRFGDKGRDGVILITTKKNTTQVVNGNGPVYFLDGKQIDASVFKLLDKNNISSVNVLKDESATAKYGDKGKYGVIEITSKKEGVDNKKYPGEITVTGYANQTELGKDVIQPPSFPGGDTAWLNYLQKNLNVNLPVSKKAPPGYYSVVVSFRVAANGAISDVKALNDPGYGTGAEAARVIKDGPNWVPAKQNGKNVDAIAKQKITFRVNEE